MGEIKSTLDLVMERTRHLSLSKEEKHQQKQADYKKRLAGLLQQYADKTLSVAELKQRIERLQVKLELNESENAPKLLITTIIERVDPDEDSGHWVELLENYSPGIYASLNEALAAYSERKKVLANTARKNISDRLAKQCGISGSALVPNLQRDVRYQEHLAALRHEIQANMAAIRE